MKLLKLRRLNKLNLLDQNPYPVILYITALARYIILQDKESDPTNLIYLASAILIVSIATVVIRFRRSKYLNIDKDKSNDL